MDNLTAKDVHRVDQIQLTSTNKFVFLNIITFNLYAFWWTYKAWRFFRDKGSPRINPVLMAIFSPFTLYFLFQRIKAFARSHGSRNNYPSGLLVLGFLIANAFGFIPRVWASVSMLQFLFFIPPFEVMNHGIKISKQYLTVQDRLSNRQIVLIVCGSIIWFYLIASNLIA